MFKIGSSIGTTLQKFSHIVLMMMIDFLWFEHNQGLTNQLGNLFPALLANKSKI